MEPKVIGTFSLEQESLSGQKNVSVYDNHTYRYTDKSPVFAQYPSSFRILPCRKQVEITHYGDAGEETGKFIATAESLPKRESDFIAKLIAVVETHNIEQHLLKAGDE